MQQPQQGQEVKLMSPESFFNQLKLSNITDDMKTFIMYMNQSLAQAQAMNQNFVLSITQLLKEKQDKGEEAKITVDLSDENVQATSHLALNVNMNKDGSIDYTLFEESGIITNG